jgi:hypothetical protein
VNDVELRFPPRAGLGLAFASEKYVAAHLAGDARWRAPEPCHRGPAALAAVNRQRTVTPAASLFRLVCLCRFQSLSRCRVSERRYGPRLTDYRRTKGEGLSPQTTSVTPSIALLSAT